MKNTYFFKDKPLFGLDIHTDSFRIMQVDQQKKNPMIISYGMGEFKQPAIKDGAIVEPKLVADTIRKFLDNGLIGKLTTKRVALSIPATRIFSRAVTLPSLPDKELEEAIQLEIEQYVPMPISTLYIDHTILSKSSSQVEVFTIAAPQQVVDSYMEIAELLELEPVLVETRPDSAHRLFATTTIADIPSLLINFGKNCVDISIIQNNIIASSTINLLPNTNKSNSSQNYELLIKEVRSMIRYYEERYGQKQRIEQVVLFGNSNNLMDLATFMTDQLRLPVRSADPWKNFSYNSNLKQIEAENFSNFTTVAGLSLAPYKEVFA